MFTCMDIHGTWNETQTATSWRTVLQGQARPWLQLKHKETHFKWIGMKRTKTEVINLTTKTAQFFREESSQ